MQLRSRRDGVELKSLLSVPKLKDFHSTKQKDSSNVMILLKAAIFRALPGKNSRTHVHKGLCCKSPKNETTNKLSAYHQLSFIWIKFQKNLRTKIETIRNCVRELFFQILQIFP